jgi:YD repeat-containing protein
LWIGSYTYDEASGGFGTGRLTTVVDQAGMLKRSYDERGNLVGETRAIRQRQYDDRLCL